MRFERATLETCEQAKDIVVVIDVLRAFSTAAYAFMAGAQSITLVGTAAEAFLLKQRSPDLLMMGEDRGKRIEGFDFSNSPAEIAGQNLKGRKLLQRTSAGTQGVVRSVNARLILTSSFCCASATARYLNRYPGRTVTFVITGKTPAGWGDEDEACADFIESLLKDEMPELDKYLQRVRESLVGRMFLDPNHAHLPAQDLDYCLAANRFNFAMLVERQNGLYIMKPVHVSL
jgi:2-phosphosulfolactate phosphatase